MERQATPGLDHRYLCIMNPLTPSPERHRKFQAPNSITESPTETSSIIVFTATLLLAPTLALTLIFVQHNPPQHAFFEKVDYEAPLLHAKAMPTEDIKCTLENDIARKPGRLLAVLESIKLTHSLVGQDRVAQLDDRSEDSAVRRVRGFRVRGDC